MSDEIKEHQDQEFAAIKAIYGDAVVDNRTAIAWNVWRPLDLMLTLIPLYDSDVPDIHCSVTLHFICCEDYPNKLPVFVLHKTHGLSADDKTRLLSELETHATRYTGQVIIHQLAEHTRQFLYDCNLRIISNLEESNNTEQEDEEIQNIEVGNEEESQNIQDEINRLNEIYREASKRPIHRSSIGQGNQEGDGEQSDSPELMYYADHRLSQSNMGSQTRTVEIPCTCKNKSTQTLRLSQKNNRKVYIGNCIGHSSNGSTTYLAIDDSGERLIAKKWIIPPSSDIKVRTKQITNIQTNFKIISRLKHIGLTPYIAMENCKEGNKKSNSQYTFLFRNYIMGSSLKYIKKKLLEFSDNKKYEGLSLVRHVGLGVLSALKELHSEGLSHMDVRCENVFLDNSSCVKLVGIDLDMRLAELHNDVQYCDRQTQVQDIQATGQMLLSIISQDCVYEYTDIPTDLPSTAKDFFARLLTEDEHLQWTAEQLVSHVFLVDIPSKQISTTEEKDDESGSEKDDDTDKNTHLMNPKESGQSRLNIEFDVLSWIGKGAFGDVLKVKNKLDGGFYAIKRVKLNPENVQLNKKITREVKLLSRLNHENVVRYYNAWIESTIQQEKVNTSVESKPNVKKSESQLKAKSEQEVKLEWSMSEELVQTTFSTTVSEDSDEDNEDDEDDEQDEWCTNLSLENESSGGVAFEENSNQSQTGDGIEKLQIQVLYIQMEFCEKHTLRQAIDAGLYQEGIRAWRLFREIVEGLAHVHQRGMIHRDLKPVNIFLDSSDHVKIGDFGLATKAFTTLPVDDKTKQEDLSGSLTGQIGTALYVAPELDQDTTKLIYNQKVDIYSLGIILFEMFHPPLVTGMERISVLTKLRSKDIVMPEDFEKIKGKQIHVIRWLLNHDPSLRPTCTELLGSEHVPRAVPEGALSGFMSHALSDRHGKGYKRLMAACLNQRPSAAEDYTYHNDMNNNLNIHDVKQAMVKVFRTHGAVEFNPPLLTPRCKRWDQYPNAVKVMTASGSICHLPHDLRLPFARHIAYTNTKYMRRYVVDRVFREKRVQEFHPKEIMECAFDIVTPKTESLWSDAELLVVASRAAMENNLKVKIQLNHTELLKTLLEACGVPRDRLASMYVVLADMSLGRITKLQFQTHLISLCVTDSDVSNLLRLMEADVAVHDLKDLISPVVKQSKWSKAMANYIVSLEVLFRNAKALGCECPMTVAPFLAYNATQHSGIFWQMSVVRNTDHKASAKHRAGNIIAAGGRYDALVEEFLKVTKAKENYNNPELWTTSVGFSMSLERIAAILNKMEIEAPKTIKKKFESALICVCLWGTAGNGKDGQAAVKRAQLARDLWIAGYNCCSWTANSCDALEMTRANVMLQQDNTGVRVIFCDQMREYKVQYSEILDFINQKLHPEPARSPEISSASTSKAACWSESEKTNSCSTSVTFITVSDRMTKNSKRHCESQINTKITSILVKLGLQSVLSKVRVNVLALSCEGPCVKMLSSELSVPLDIDELEQAFKPVCDAYPKHVDILDDALKELSTMIKQSNQSRTDEIQLYALYSIPDSLCRLIT